MESKWTDNKIFEDENHFCRIDFSASLWAMTNLTKAYSKAKIHLSSVDTALETDNLLLLMEYKNANIKEARKGFEPASDKTLRKVSKKYYDSLFYTLLKKRPIGKPKIYVWILEAPRGDSFLRGHIQQKLKKQLPFLLQEQNNFAENAIDELYVISIEEWSRMFKQFPISVKQNGKFVSVEA